MEFVKSLPNKFIALLLTGFCMGSLFAQTTPKSESMPFIYATYALQMPGGDMAQRFGINSDIGAGLGFKTQSNWIIGAEATYIFGNNLNEDPLGSIANSLGQITNRYGQSALVYEHESGYQAKVTLGKIIPVLVNNPNSGIYIRAGVGVLQHRIRYDNIGNNTPQMLDDYARGYDRMCNGLAINEFLGWQHFSNKKYFHFFAGLEFTQAFTSNQRAWDFATKQTMDEPRLDLLYSFRVGLLILFKSRQANQYYYY